MNSIIIFQALESRWSPESWAVENGADRGKGGEFVVEGVAGWVSVVQDKDLVNDYDLREMDLVRKLIPEFNAYVIEWRGDDLMSDLLNSAPFGHFALVDNDHGLLVPFGDIRDIPCRFWVQSNKLEKWR
ncbi:hypothetical protein LVB77_00640 [Lysobacter sp. 5GHs7-4]|uniref:hypothetical protein n=1 Tax=Lysobacter sp. 5GHs7-4 TaxID=2904253 RepID=UPI001E487E31|nr:hypothetical protein [Lysobacter sp. 5GHs7-4]UHQ23254.1 hypothetical protein LVB77_00640 [Lysobacter sp. 5GHs7-4]